MTRLVRCAALAILACALASACVAEPTRQLSAKDLENVAMRVRGGGAECPLRFDREHLRPREVSPDSIISPLRVAGHAAMGTIGKDKPESSLGRREGVQVDCWFRLANMRIDVSVVAVRDGKALAQLATRLEQHAKATPADMATFISAYADLAAGTAQAVPGKGSVAFARVSSGDSDMGLLVAYNKIDGKGSPPANDEVARHAQQIAVDLAS